MQAAVEQTSKKAAAKVAITPAITTPIPSLLARVAMSQEVLTVDDFIAIEGHPRQRDTERHLKSAIKKHLAVASPVHRRVNIAMLDGVRYKLDGHTRALAWSRNLLERPATLRADVYHCETREDLLELYTHFDNKAAVETTSDTLSGALRQVGVQVTSKALERYGFATALQIASRCFGVAECTDVYTNAAQFAKEIEALDGIEPLPAMFQVGVIAGAIIVLRRHGTSALPFFEALNMNAGVKTAATYDAVQALAETISRKTGRKSGFGRTLDIAGKTISAAERYMKGETYVNTKTGVQVKPTSLSSYLAKHTTSPF